MVHDLEGVVESGFGLAASSLAPLHEAIQSRTRLAIVPGTLNVRLDEPYIVVPNLVLEARDYEHHETILLQHCRIYEAPALIVRTSTQAAGESHPLEVIEILATETLRETRGLSDGDRIVIQVALRV